MASIIGWLTWDPSRELFIIPWVNRPIGWYGLLFALGFAAGYVIMVRLFARKISERGEITAQHIESWPKLVGLLRKGITARDPAVLRIVDALSNQERSELLEGRAASPDLKKGILMALNEARRQCGRTYLQTVLPGALASARAIALTMTDALCWFVILGTVVGARLGQVLFYDWPHFSEYPIDILKVWEGGLASHGGTVGVMIAIILYMGIARRYLPHLKYLALLDLLAIPAAFVACCIRLGNFFNQEIVGTETSVPWAIIFIHPFDATGVVPRHPVQLYEAFFYLGVFLFLYSLWKRRGEALPEGTLLGYLFTLVFGARIAFEFFKETQGTSYLDGWVQTGQLLSIPFVVCGLWLLCRASEYNRGTVGER